MIIQPVYRFLFGYYFFNLIIRIDLWLNMKFILKCISEKSI